MLKNTLTKEKKLDKEENIKKSSKSADSNPMKVYLDEMNKYSLLNEQEEKELSKEIEAGNEEALNRLINSNLKLVVKIAKIYVCKEYPLNDIIQDGNLGLIKAAKKFDYRKNVRFSTYASWWIKQTIKRSLSVRKRLIRLPHRKEEKLRKIKHHWNDYIQQFKKEPEVEEIAGALKIPVKEVKNLMSVSQNVMYLENSATDDESCKMLNIIEDNSYTPEELLEDKNLKQETMKILNSLIPKEKTIIENRYGLNNTKKSTLKSMGELFGISAETVRQIELRALKKLRNRFSYLKEYIDL